MGLENPFYLADFISGNPASTDQRHEGDDHIRNLKVALKNTFPGLGGRAWRKRSVVSGGPINLTDNMSVLSVTGGLTVVPAAAATLGNGFICYVRANGGSVTIDPGEPINGAGSFIVPDGYIAILMCDGTEFFTMLAYSTIPTTTPVFPAGTKLVFNQTTPPAGWSKITTATYNDASLRMTTGTVGTGGADAFTTMFGTGKSTAGYSLSAAENGPHTHGGVYGGGGSDQGNPQPSANGAIVDVRAPTSTASSGSGSAHAHTLSGFNIKYVDVIVASKD